MPHSPARSRAQIVLSDVSVARGATRVLREINLTVSPASRVAIVGENGRGKSTLMHVLDGTLAPDEGTVTRTGTLAIADQEMSADHGRTVGDALAEAIADSRAALAELDEAGKELSLAEGGAEAQRRYSAALERAEALDAWDAERRIQIAVEALSADPDPSRRLAELSVGQRNRIRLACLIGGDSDFLLLDEPSNHLDRAGLEFLTSRIRDWRGGVVLVSHDRALLADVATTVVDLDPTPDGLPRMYGDGYEGYRKGRAAEIARWEQDFARQEAERSRLKGDLDAAQDRLISGWKPDKGTGKHQRETRARALVRSVHRRQSALDDHAVDTPEPPQRFRLPELRSRAGASLITAEEVTVDQRLPEPVSISVRGGSRLVVTGPNGAGKSTLLAVLAGDVSPSSGRVSRASGARIGLLRQESDLPPATRVTALYTGHVDRLIARGQLAANRAVGLRELGLLRRPELNKRVEELSMGQQRRLDLALILATQPQVLLMDEPTNHLSIALVEELTEDLGDTKAAVVLSSHDRQLLRDTATWPTLELGSVEAVDAAEAASLTGS